MPKTPCGSVHVMCIIALVVIFLAYEGLLSIGVVFRSTYINDVRNSYIPTECTIINSEIDDDSVGFFARINYEWMVDVNQEITTYSDFVDVCHSDDLLITRFCRDRSYMVNQTFECYYGRDEPFSSRLEKLPEFFDNEGYVVLVIFMGLGVAFFIGFCNIHFIIIRDRVKEYRKTKLEVSNKNESDV